MELSSNSNITWPKLWWGKGGGGYMPVRTKSQLLSLFSSLMAPLTFSVAIFTSFSLNVAFSFLQQEHFYEEQYKHLQLFCLTHLLYGKLSQSILDTKIVCALTRLYNSCVWPRLLMLCVQIFHPIWWHSSLKGRCTLIEIQITPICKSLYVHFSCIWLT